MKRGRDPGALLERALLTSAAAAGCAARIDAVDWSRWASATFTGARQTVTLVGDGSPAFEAWLAGLPEAELPLRGHLVADLAIVARRRLTIGVEIAMEILTVEDR